MTVPGKKNVSDNEISKDGRNCVLDLQYFTFRRLAPLQYFSSDRE